MATAAKKQRKEEAYPWKASASSGHTTNLKQSILRLSISMAFHHCTVLLPNRTSTMHALTTSYFYKIANIFRGIPALFSQTAGSLLRSPWAEEQAGKMIVLYTIIKKSVP